MDILDTFGDWVQLILFAGLGLSVVTYTGAFLRHFIPPFITALLWFGLIWVTVYDYDIVIGWMIGTALSSLANIHFHSEAQKIGDGYNAKLASDALFSTGAVFLCCVLKIILFW